MLSCRSSGNGPAVVLLHGFPLSRAIWDSQVSHLASRYRVIAPDLPGLGESPPLPPGEPVTMARMAVAVLETLDGLGIHRAAFAGHSMGGYVTLALHNLAPERVTGLAMVSSQAGADTPEAKANRFATAEQVNHEGAAVVASTMGTKLFAPSIPADGAMYMAVQSIIRQTSVKGIRDALLAMAEREDLRAHLIGVRVPALVVVGRQDQLIPPERSEFMAGAIPGAELARIPQAGHMPMMEDSEGVNAAFDRWLERVYA
ncbi:MAG TPA: alpha/beta fold hydrolase [Symbiobacteriaceae bacterium]|jgi:pimeloyl-ACP methyl ester carboxylesterase